MLRAPPPRAGELLMTRIADSHLLGIDSRSPRTLESCVLSVSQFSQLSAPDAGVIFVEGGVPEMRTGRAKKPISSASDPSNTSGRFWTGDAVRWGRLQWPPAMRGKSLRRFGGRRSRRLRA